MNDEAGPMSVEQPIQPLLPARPSRTGGIALLSALLAFVLGAILAGWLAWSGQFDRFLPGRQAASAPVTMPQKLVAPASTLERDQSAALGGIEGRLALLEERFTRIDAQANAASGNAARAEGLLIAFAARRAIDRGAPLGYIADQLKLRFGGAQPLAVQQVLDAARQPVTLDQLSIQLDAAAPTLSGTNPDESIWTRGKREFSSLFVLRRATTPTARPLDRVVNAKLMLAAGRVEEAIAEIERLPGAGEAHDWIVAARRYGSAQRALDLIETTAMLEQRLLDDGRGQPVKQPSPLTPPAPAAAE